MSFRTVRNLGLGIMLLIVLLVSLLSYRFMSVSAQKLEIIITIEEVKLKKWLSLAERITDAKNSFFDYYAGKSELIAPTTLIIEKVFKEVEDIRKLTADNGYELIEINQLLEELKVFRQAVYAFGLEVSEGYKGGTSAKEMGNIALEAADNIVQLKRAAIEEIIFEIEKHNRSMLKTTKMSKKILSVVLIVFIFSTVLVALFMGRALAKPINELVKVTENVAKGDLTQEIEVKYHDEIGELSSSFNYMVKELKVSKKQLEFQAFYDQLTSLPNRANFLLYLERMLKRTKWRSDYLFAVLFIDLDRFKIINDSLGHVIGDKLLVEVARRLEACTRPTDRISRIAGNDRVSRFGGDEFAVFLHDIKDISSASRVADRIQMKLQKPFKLDGHELFTSASIGIALSATGYENEENILRDADSAMYRAKALGRARSEIFDDEMHVRVTQILQLEADLRTAVEKEQFMVYYQPIVSTTDSRITGAEALIRWNHPEQGFIPPLDFIPIAEETGLISAIGEWVLRTACAQNKAWQDAGYPNLLMKVNFSSRQFKDENLPEMVKKVIRETSMPAQLLDIEITENIAMEKSSIRILNQMTAMGLQTSIDDFGTGYSSLGSLTQFPINTIKIDRVFIKDIMIDVNAEAIIKAIIAMAHSLKMEVVAEGVETEDQLAFLQSEKCDKIQGYLFSRPVPEEEFRKLLEQDKIGHSPINKHSASMV